MAAQQRKPVLMTSLASILVHAALLVSAPAAVAADQRAEGAELIGTMAPEWDIATWLNSEPLRLEDLRGRVILLRWWTDTCPYCGRSAPALKEFHDRYASRGLTVIGIYHPKPKGRTIDTSQIRAAAEERGFRFPIAIDRDWSMLRQWWLDGGHRSATSVSFLIDRRGVIRHIHPGPAYHREVIDGEAGPRRDFVELEGMIEKLLAERD